MSQANITFYTMENEVSKGHLTISRFDQDEIRSSLCKSYPHFLDTKGLCALVEDIETGETLTLINTNGGIICT